MEEINNTVFDKFISMLGDIVADQVKEKLEEHKDLKEENKLMITPKEAMTLLGVGHNTMYENLLRNDDFPKIIIGKKFYIPVKELKEWISRQVNK